MNSWRNDRRRNDRLPARGFLTRAAGVIFLVVIGHGGYWQGVFFIGGYCPGVIDQEVIGREFITLEARAAPVAQKQRIKCFQHYKLCVFFSSKSYILDYNSKRSLMRHWNEWYRQMWRKGIVFYLMLLI